MKTESNLNVEPDEAKLIRRGIRVMIFSVCCFTGNTLILRLLGTERFEMSAALPLFFRAAVGILIALLFFRGHRPTRIKPVFTQKKLILRGITGFIGTAAYYYTVPTLGAAKATLFCNTYVIFAAVLAAIWLREKLSLVRAIWLILAVIGVGLLASENSEGIEFGFGLNELIAIGGAIAAAWTIILIRQLVIEHGNGTIFMAQCIWILLPVAFLSVHELPGLGALEWGLLIGAASCAAFGQLMMNEGYRCLSVTVGASIQMLWPVMTAIGGLLFFDERFLPLQVVGAVLILSATWRVSVRKRQKILPTSN
ncbi:MAG: DMT family transporter [Verrucomicrobiales bacterium]|nr:DMT family transporter [Verrucomicrobiales bacterium]